MESGCFPMLGMSSDNEPATIPRKNNGGPKGWDRQELQLDF